MILKCLPICIAFMTCLYICIVLKELYNEYKRKTNNIDNNSNNVQSIQTNNSQERPQSTISKQLFEPSAKQHKIFEDDNISEDSFDRSDLTITNLFDFNPPQSIKEIQETFINRVKELESDVQYFHDRFCSNRINVIYGMSRTGKSHYMKKLLIELDTKNRPFWMKYINANSKETVRCIFYEIFRYLKEAIDICASTGNKESNPDIQFVRLLFLDINKLIDKDIDIMKPEHTKTFFSNNNNDFLSYFSDLPAFIQSFRDEKNCFYSRPSNTELVELIKFQAKFLVKISHEQYQSVLLAIDDVDLLYLLEERKDEVNYLYQLLSELSASETINVLITTRQGFATDRGKEFEYFREILPLNKIDDFKNLYMKRIELYNNNQEVFTSDALDYLIDCAEGKPGVFLNQCKKIFAGNDVTKRKSKADIINALDAIVVRYLDSNNRLKGYVETIKSEVLTDDEKNRSLTVNLPNDVSNTELLFFFILPTNQSGEFEINKLIKDYFELRAMPC